MVPSNLSLGQTLCYLFQLLVTKPSLLRLLLGTSVHNPADEPPRLWPRITPDPRRARQEPEQVGPGGHHHATTGRRRGHHPSRPHVHLRYFRHRPGEPGVLLPVRHLQLAAGPLHLHLLLRVQEGRAEHVAQTAAVLRRGRREVGGDDQQG